MKMKLLKYCLDIKVVYGSATETKNILGVSCGNRKMNP
jgi:hypothetical protein